MKNIQAKLKCSRDEAHTRCNERPEIVQIVGHFICLGSRVGIWFVADKDSMNSCGQLDRQTGNSRNSYRTAAFTWIISKFCKQTAFIVFTRYLMKILSGIFVDRSYEGIWFVVSGFTL